MITFYVYIIKSERLNILYKGYTSDPVNRLREHNEGFSRYTKGKGPWTLVYLEKCASKTDAMKRENSLKKANRAYIEWLCKQSYNIAQEVNNTTK